MDAVPLAPENIIKAYDYTVKECPDIPFMRVKHVYPNSPCTRLEVLYFNDATGIYTYEPVCLDLWFITTENVEIESPDEEHNLTFTINKEDKDDLSKTVLLFLETYIYDNMEKLYGKTKKKFKPYNRKTFITKKVLPPEHVINKFYINKNVPTRTVGTKPANASSNIIATAIRDQEDYSNKRISLSQIILRARRNVKDKNNQTTPKQDVVEEYPEPNFFYRFVNYVTHIIQSTLYTETELPEYIVKLPFTILLKKNTITAINSVTPTLLLRQNDTEEAFSSYSTKSIDKGTKINALVMFDSIYEEGKTLMLKAEVVNFTIETSLLEAALADVGSIDDAAILAAMTEANESRNNEKLYKSLAY